MNDKKEIIRIKKSFRIYIKQLQIKAKETNRRTKRSKAQLGMTRPHPPSPSMQHWWMRCSQDEKYPSAAAAALDGHGALLLLEPAKTKAATKTTEPKLKARHWWKQRKKRQMNCDVVHPSRPNPIEKSREKWRRDGRKEIKEWDDEQVNPNPDPRSPGICCWGVAMGVQGWWLKSFKIHQAVLSSFSSFLGMVVKSSVTVSLSGMRQILFQVSNALLLLVKPLRPAAASVSDSRSSVGETRVIIL